MASMTSKERRERYLESRRRGAARQHAQHVNGPKIDSYVRKVDIRAMVLDEDRERGRCTW